MMDIPSHEFCQLKRTLLDKGNKPFHDFLMIRYSDEPKQGAETVRLKEMEDASRILEATASWTDKEKYSAGVNRVSVMVQSPWPKQMPFPIPSTSSTPKKRKRTSKVDTTIVTTEPARKHPKPGPGFRDMVLENTKRTGLVSSISASEFYGVANDFNPVQYEDPGARRVDGSEDE
ncbi:hypothetical protein QM012_006230 [Aureobasidium pullulans]|uniref:Uncharacterized protein n=1 Tax=Aureobasidium pullulans TaxID=5580 RepID=A0ABR0TT17_AURPU